MLRTFANANRCPRCGSIDVDIVNWGMPSPSFGNYMRAYEELSFVLTAEAFPEAPGLHLEMDVDDLDESFYEWFAPEKGRGVYAPGNRYDNGGCMIPMGVDPSTEPCSCRNCGAQWENDH
ncbi:MAG: hypothetical protein WCL38_00975 [Actinomycetota bacterium]